MLELRDLRVLDEFRAVERLEGEIWGPIDLVPVPILAVSVKRGAILVGAFDGARMAGFVYSFPALRPGASRASHWSHMLGVHPDYRGTGLGRQLKLEQRARALALELDLIEWTFDPLQALNAHLNFARLGVIVEEYEENVYGESPSPLHGGLPTDRFVCQWWIRRPHVERRVRPPALSAVSHEVARAPVVNRTEALGEWLAPAGFDRDGHDRRLFVEIPADFTAMLAAAPGLALRWRLETRTLFEHYFARGYRAVDFSFDRARRLGRYLLTNQPAAEPPPGPRGPGL
jgi:predicted GNAT superfamily acetyltransferase